MKKRLLSICLMLMALVVLLAVPASAEMQPMDISIYGTQDYTEINEVLRLVNEARAAEGKDPLVMDPTLVKYAMQRAAEIAVYYSHTRPDGSSCFTVMESTHYYGASGENIAIGYTSAADVTNGWLNSEGHYNNIMGVNYDFQTIGIGCFYQDDGTMCWVRLFSSLPATGTYNKSGTVDVSQVNITVQRGLLMDDLHLYGLRGCHGFELYNTDTEKLKFQVENPEFGNRVTLDGKYTMSMEDSSIAKLNSAGTTVTGMKAGQTTLTVVFDNLLTTNINVTVWNTPTLKVEVTESGSHKITWTDEGGEVYLFCKDWQEDYLWRLLAYPSSTSYEHTMTNDNVYLADTWTYVLKLRNQEGDAYYEISPRVVIGDLQAPTLKVTNVASTGKPKLSWNAVSGAAKYEIYVSTSENSGYTKTATVTGTSVTHNSAKAGTRYYYRVRAVKCGWDQV